MVFRSFEAFVSEKFGDDVVETLMSHPDLSTGGAYTSIGNYPHTDFLTLAGSLADETGVPLKSLVTDFGEALFHILAGAHQDMVKGYKSALDLLSVIESVIHRDVRKLYSDTELPRFDIIEKRNQDFLHMAYSSARPFADLAEGLIWGCLDHYDVKEISLLERHDVATDGTHTEFKILIKRQDGSNAK